MNRSQKLYGKDKRQYQAAHHRKSEPPLILSDAKFETCFDPKLCEFFVRTFPYIHERKFGTSHTIFLLVRCGHLKISSLLIHFWRFSPFFKAKRRTTYSNWFEKKAAAQGLKWVDWMMTTRMHSGKCRCLILNFNANAVCMKFNALDLVSSKFCLTKYKTKRTKKT